MYELHSIKFGKGWSSLIHSGMKFYFRSGKDFYKMRIMYICKNSIALECGRQTNHNKCLVRCKIKHSFDTVPWKKRSMQFSNTVTKDQLACTSNYQLEDEIRDNETHLRLCKISKDDICQTSQSQIKQSSTSDPVKPKTSGRNNSRSKSRSTQNNPISAINSSDDMGVIMEPVPPELQFLLDGPEVAVDITNSDTEFEFTAEEILSGGEQATMIILPNPAFQIE